MGTSNIAAVLIWMLTCAPPACMKQEGHITRERHIQVPRIVRPVTDQDLVVSLNKKLTFNCLAESSPLPRYQWRFNGRPMQDFPDLGYKEGEGEGGATLSIGSTTAWHTGTYQCLATMSVSLPSLAPFSATSVSPAFRLHVAEEPVWVRRSELHTEQATTGLPSKLHCGLPVRTAPLPPHHDTLPPHHGTLPHHFRTLTPHLRPLVLHHGTLPPHLQWLWYQDVDNSTQVQDSENIAIDREGTLHFLTVTAGDSNGGGPYTCALINAVSGKITLGPPVFLQVTDAGAPVPTAPSMAFSTSIVQSLLGETAVLECVFSGFPPPSITWQGLKESPLGTAGRKHSLEKFGRRLIISSVAARDGGEYTCTGTNQFGILILSIALRVVSRPLWVEPLRDSNVVHGAQAVFKCRAQSLWGEALPTPPLWFWNGSPLGKTPEDAEISLSADGRTLTVHRADIQRHTACLQCQVSNDVGTSQSQGCLTVTAPIHITRLSLPARAVHYGQILSWTLVARTRYPGRVSHAWFYRGPHSVRSPLHFLYTIASPDSLVLAAQIRTADLSFPDYVGITGSITLQLSTALETVNISTELVPVDIWDLGERPLLDGLGTIPLPRLRNGTLLQEVQRGSSQEGAPIHLASLKLGAASLPHPPDPHPQQSKAGAIPEAHVAKTGCSADNDTCSQSAGRRLCHFPISTLLCSLLSLALA